MIDNIIGFSIKNKVIIGLLTVVLICSGLWAMKTLPIDAQPDITNNQVQVITTAPKLGTEDIEQFVTYPLEVALANLPGVDEIRSVSRFGLSVVTIVFNDDMGTLSPRQLVSEKLVEVRKEIPEGFGETFMGPISTGLGEIYQYTIEVEDKYKDLYSSNELRTIQDWIIKRQMAMVKGVIEINSVGGGIKQYEIKFNPDILQSMEISISDIFTALKNNNQNTGGAYIEKEYKANYIRGEGLVRSIDDLKNIVVAVRNNTPVLIKDVAEVNFSNAIRYGALTKDGKGEAVGGIIMMLKDANSNEVIDNVKDRIAEIQKTLPKGVSIKPFLDRSLLIKQTTSTVSGNLIEGALIVIFVLVILLGNWRGGLIVASTIPLSLFFALIMMKITGVWANLMSLGAIDFGIIVDGAVIIVESVVATISHRVRTKVGSSDSMDSIVKKSASKMMNSAFFGQFIILIVFVPILALEGIEGKMFKPMALTFGYAVLGATILCLTYVPMISSIFLKIPKIEKRTFGDKFVSSLENGFEPILKASLKYGKWIMASAIGIMIIAGVIFAKMGGEFIPQLDEGDIAFHALLKPGTSLSETIKTTTRIEGMLKEKFPEIKQIVSRIGVADVPTDPMPMDIADVFVIMKDKKEWTSASSKDEMINKMKAVVNTLPGVNYEFTQPMEMRFNELLTGVREDIAIKLFGEDLDILAQKAEEMGKIIAGTKGVADMKVEATSGLPQITVHYDREKLARYGLSIEDVNNVLSTAFAGSEAGVLFEGEKRFDIVVRLDSEFRKSIDDIRDIRITLPNGAKIPMEEVAKISYTPGPMQITRENTNRRTYIGINVRGRDIASLVAEIKQKLDDKLVLPAGYYIRYGGAFENLERAKSTLNIVLPIVLLLIFLLIFFALRSIKQAVMIFGAIPLATIGGIIALEFRDMPFSISAGVGFIVLFGVAVLNGLVLINSYNDLKKEGVSLKERILNGTRHRIRPILLTASTDVLGFLPMAISDGAGAEVQRPLATVVIGGLFTSTILTLILLPILYKWIEERKSIKINIKPAIAPILIIMFLGISSNTYSQNNVTSLEQAVENAKKNYPSIRKSSLKVEKQNALRITSYDLGTTTVYTSEDNRDGSIRGDKTNIGVNQTGIDLLSIYSKNKLQNKKIESAKKWKEYDELELEMLVRTSWFKAYISKKRYELYVKLDSIYSNFEKAAKISESSQASSNLEYLGARSKSKRISINKINMQKDYIQAINELNTYTIVPNKGVMDIKKINYIPLDINDRSFLSNPLITSMISDIEVGMAGVQNEKTALLPKFDVGYYIQSTNTSNNLRGFSFGINIPLWFGPQSGRIKAAKKDLEILKQDKIIQELELIKRWNNTFEEYNKQKVILDLYNNETLDLSEKQINAATLAYKEGNINYFTYVTNLENALSIKMGYYETLFQFYYSQTQLLFLSGNFNK